MILNCPFAAFWGVVGLNTVVFSPWNRTARSPLQSLLTDSNGVVIS